MDSQEYHQQLEAINQMLQGCPEGSERSELISLKQNIEELLHLTNEVEKYSKPPSKNDEKHCKPPSKKDESSLVIDKNVQENIAEIDNEYALFMAEMAKEGAVEVHKPNSDSTNADTSRKKHTVLESSKSFKYLEGKKFKAPHKHQWGQMMYHNAMVCSVPDKIPGNNEFEVKVLFLNPTHKEMQPCPYYFHLEKDCNYTDEECGYSHGEMVPFSSLQEYIEPKFELLTIGSDVLAKQSNNLWYRAKITQIMKEKCLVKFDSKNVENQFFQEVIFANILPLEITENDSEGDSRSDSDVEVVEDFELQLEKDRQELINMSLAVVPETQKLGDWEKYTKGIGSRLMQKMGYIVGTGLGKKGSGIIKPVTAIILPQGKSLDYCMNLKEKKNNPDLFNADTKVHKSGKRGTRKERRMRRQEDKQKRKVVKNQARYEQMDLVMFLNSRFQSGKLHWIQKKEKEIQLLRDKLKSGSDKELNTANFLIEEKLKKQHKTIEVLRANVKRFEEVHSDRPKLRQKLSNRESDIAHFNTYKTMIKNEIDRRKNNKEMAVF